MDKRIFGNRYQIIEKIGMGGMAEVYKATDSTLGRTVALKVMLPQYAADPTFAARFRQEAQAAANLQSPYIVNIYDWGQDDGAYYIVMEYVRGTDLKTAITQRGKIHPRKVAEIGAQVCSALSIAHGYDIIHRDIKSANIMVQTDGNVKVMDFGIAQAGNQSVTTGSSVLGTAHYVSPEQAQGKTLAPTSDLYSLGVVMYEAATGQLPFDGPDAVSVALKQVSEQPVPPRQINPNISPALESIIMRAMAKNPDDRFSTANEMRKALEGYLAGRSTPGGAAPVVGTAAAYNGGHTSVMSPVASKAGKVSQAPRGNGGDRNRGGKKKAIIALIVVLFLVAAGFGIAYVTGTFTQKVIVPGVTGMTQQEATTTLQQYGLKAGNITYQTSNTVASGDVISQDPEANSATTPGSSVNLVLSEGPTSSEMVSVPNLTGLSETEANQQLTSVGLVGSSSEDYSDTIAKGKVFEQSPAALSQAPKGSTVTFKISLGKKKENVTVPSVIGLSESDAVDTLETLGLVVKTKEGYSEDVNDGEVFNQSIGANTSVASGSTITLTVCKKTQVPDVTGRTQSSATSKLQTSGFEVSVIKVANDSSIGKVISQDPTGGSYAQTGSTVTITVGIASGN